MRPVERRNTDSAQIASATRARESLHARAATRRSARPAHLDCNDCGLLLQALAARHSPAPHRLDHRDLLEVRVRDAAAALGHPHLVQLPHQRGVGAGHAGPGTHCRLPPPARCPRGVGRLSGPLPALPALTAQAAQLPQPRGAARCCTRAPCQLHGLSSAAGSRPRHPPLARQPPSGCRRRSAAAQPRLTLASEHKPPGREGPRGSRPSWSETNGASSLVVMITAVRVQS